MADSPSKVVGKFNMVFFKRYPDGYVDRNNADRKGVFKQMGMVIQKDDGSFTGFVDSMPLNWDGQFKLYPVKEREEGSDFS